MAKNIRAAGMDTYGSDVYFMNEALKEARKALEMDEVPIGAVVVCGGKVVSRGHNMTQRLNDVTAHAEMIAITAAANYLGAKYLADCTLYVTIEPCVMCAGACSWAQAGRVVFGARDIKKGYSTIATGIMHPRTKVTGGINEDECGSLVSSYFSSKRK